LAWDPKTYLAFGAERGRAASDLLARIGLESPRRVADLGCGPGNSTALLRARWPNAEIDAIDNSLEMLRDARASGVRARVSQCDIAAWRPDAPYDVIFSNAALQWLGDHESLFPRLFSYLAPGGVLAVQVPRNYDELCQVLVRKLAGEPRWAEKLAGVRDWWNGLAPERYYDLLSPRARRIDLWETRYFHILEGEDAVFRWMLGTSLRPFLGSLNAADAEQFASEYKQLLATAYPAQPDGKTIHRFLRLFLVASG